MTCEKGATNTLLPQSPFTCVGRCFMLRALARATASRYFSRSSISEISARVPSTVLSTPAASLNPAASLRHHAQMQPDVSPCPSAAESANRSME